MPTQMLGIASGRPGSADGKGLPPMDAHGIQAVSISFLRDPEQPTASRIGDPTHLPQESCAQCRRLCCTDQLASTCIRRSLTFSSLYVRTVLGPATSASRMSRRHGARASK
jgi:hypothetical protein